jgi:DNA-binding response OmpR family regulator
MTGESTIGTVLIVDDDQDQRWMVDTYLSQYRYVVHCAEEGNEMRDLLAQHTVDVVIMDVNLPGEDGFVLTRYLREKHDVGIIMLTAATELADRVLGLEMGADDYLVKPFEPRELLARVKSVMRRTNQSVKSESIYRFGNYELDATQFQITCDGQVQLVEPRSIDLLIYLVENRDRVVTKDEIFDNVWKGRVVTESSIFTSIKQLRRAIGDDGKTQNAIRTVHGRGFQFVGQLK